MGGRRLKVFEAQFGFCDSVVAAALRAWGTHQNLFASGRAKVTTDARAVAAALQHPETPLRRAVGSGDPFQLEPASLPKVPAAPKRTTPAPLTGQKPMARPPADRSKLDAAETVLKAEARRSGFPAPGRRA